MSTYHKNTPKSFHPTLTLVQFFRYLMRSFKSPDTEQYLPELFPDHNATLVDSGRSAFALVIERLDLTDKTIVLPAYVCDAFLPVLMHYNITPLFLDVDEETYQPPLSAYTDDVLSEADAVLLVATYGRTPDQKIITHLIEHGTMIIEDFAMRSPFLNDPLSGAARIYSLPKTLPVPDGGIALIHGITEQDIVRGHKCSLTFLKDVLKLLPKMGPLIAHVRNAVKRSQTAPAWSEIRSASRLTKTIFRDYCLKTRETPLDAQYVYCYPVQITDPVFGATKLKRYQIFTERIWSLPLVANPNAQEQYNLVEHEFPTTHMIADHIICAPLWHVRDQQSYTAYIQTLEEVLADLRCE